ncbi:LysR family transcriptional regulator [Novosphingobium rosa]|uniref:LysR family transcriptional regulator n=1 Tax=Novosphingobium rosa TaxID=76978 RepID=UPI00082F4273|nr:LysR family transcriptional regulator [Novosphingobium rosa]
MIDFRRLRYFLEVATTRSFTRAADNLHMAQPPLSKRIQELEADLGAPLFDREARPLALTPAGRLLYEQGSQIMQRMDQLSVTMRDFVAARRRRLVLGMVTAGFHAHLPEVIRRFQAVAPDIDLTLHEMGTLEQIVALKDGRIDAALGRVRVEDPSLAREVLREEPLLLALPIDHPGNRGEGPVDLRLLEETRLIVFPKGQSPSFADNILSQCHDHGVRLCEVMEVQEGQMALILVAAGLGVSLIPESARLMARPEIALRPVKQVMTAPIILYHRLGDLSYELRMMLRTCAQLYAEWGESLPESVQDLIAGPAPE